MIVDDHADMRRMLRSVVSFTAQKHIEFLECESGEQALEHYAMFSPDFVLMDIELSGIDGFKTTEKIKSQNPESKILIITSHDSNSFRKKANDLKVIGYVTKDNLSNINDFLQNKTT